MNKNYLNLAFSPTFLSIVVSSSIFSVDAKDYFDPSLLSLGSGSSEIVDLSAYETPGQTPPGTYLVNLYLNQNDLGQHSITFKLNKKNEVYPEFTIKLLNEIGVNTESIPKLSSLSKDGVVENLSELIPESSVHFDFAQQRLDLSIPQIAMQPKARGYVDPSLWDEGVPAFLMNYTLNGGRNWQVGSASTPSSEQTNLFANLSGGFNVGAWRLRSDMVYTYNDSDMNGGNSERQQKTRFNNIYIQRDIKSLRSEVLAGESSTGNDVFDSIPFKGIKLNSSEDMLPTSMRGFAPLITGIAQSNARVTVTQNGNIVYQTFVAPGPFKIEDLYQTGQGGDLLVTITEADGSVRTQTVAFSSLPLMQRPGGYKYEVTTGKYNGGVTINSKEADFVQSTLIYGLPHDITLYGGTLFAKDYISFVFGSGLSMGGFGALSADVTTSNTKLSNNDESKSGNSYRIRYSKSLLDTGTSVDLTAYRYSTANYYSFSDFNNTGYRLSDDQVPWALGRQRSNFQVRLSQQLEEYGAIYLTGSRNDYWGSEQVNNTVSAGYTNRYKGINYSLAYSIDRIKGSGEWPQNRQFSFNMQIPLSVFNNASLASRSYASYQMSHNNQGQVQQQTGINGTALDDRLSYNVMQGWSNSQNNNSSTVNLGYQGSQGAANIGYGYSDKYRSLNMSANGGVVIHPKGITFSQMLGSSVAIVAAPDASNTSVMNGNITTDQRGYAVVPYLSNYQNNIISLNPATLPDDVDITQSSTNVYPTKGAVVMAKFATRVGTQALITLSKGDKKLPFGTLVSVVGDDNTDNTGIVGEGGQVYLSGLPDTAILSAKWGSSISQQCKVRYSLKELPAPSKNNPVRVLDLACSE